MIAWESEFIARQRVARLATVDAQGQPHVVPIVFAFEADRVFTPLDAKPKRVSAHQLQRVRNIQHNPHVAVIFDEYQDDWRQLAWVQIRGSARVCTDGADHERGVRLLHAKYPQYESLPLHQRPIIVIAPQHVTSWRARADAGPA